MKMKKSTITTLSILLVFALAIGAVAAVYILQQAKVTVFSGHLDFSKGDQPSENDEAELVVKAEGIKAGHEISVTGYGEDAVPVLLDVESRYVDWNHYVWEDKNGNEALAARQFVLTAKGGGLDDLTYDINVVGNPTIVSALRFGFVTEYDDDEYGRVTNIFSTMVDGQVALPETLGDGNIAKEEEIKVSVSVWADAYALADLGDFDDMDFNVDIIFSAG